MTTEDLVTLAHQRHQGIPYLTGDPLLDRLPEWLRDLADHILSGQAKTGEGGPGRGVRAGLAETGGDGGDAGAREERREERIPEQLRRFL